MPVVAGRPLAARALAASGSPADDVACSVCAKFDSSAVGKRFAALLSNSATLKLIARVDREPQDLWSVP